MQDVGLPTIKETVAGYTKIYYAFVNNKEDKWLKERNLL